MSSPEPRAPLHVAYSGSEAAAHSFAAFLHERGIEAQVLDRPNVIVWLAALGTYRFRVGVPEAERERARAAREEWDAYHAPRAGALARRIHRILAWSLLPPAAWWLAARALPATVPEISPGGGFLAWLLGLVVIAQLEHRRRRGAGR